MERSEKVEAYFSEEHHYKKAIGILRDLVLQTELEETFKWMFPTYTLANKNVLAICRFKGHFGIWFFNGVFLKDPINVLENAQEGKTKAMRHWKFLTIENIDKKLVLGYVKEAIENQKNGRILAPLKSTKKVIIPALLTKKLNNNKELKLAFESLSSYKQKEFYEYIETAKQEKTKTSRLEKIIPMILDGIGLNDKYR